MTDSQSPMASDDSQLSSPIRADRFSIQIDGIVLETLKSVSGLSLEVEVETKHYVGARSGSPFIVKTPGRRNAPSITIIRSLDKSDELTKWIAESRQDSISKAKRNVTIELMNGEEQSEKRTATLTGVWVSKWSIGDLTAGDSSEVDETVVLECDTIGFK